MKGKEVRLIREKLGLSVEEFADLLCLAGYQSVMNIESDFRKPSKLAIRLLRYLDEQKKKNALEFIMEFKSHEPK
ncbi:MAG: helix-turn-helix domain-containing protein [Bacteriovoracaceae bacterium]